MHQLASGTTRASRASRAKPVSWRDRLRRLVPFLLVLAGVGVLLYPVAATQFNNTKQREFAQTYNTEVQQISQTDRTAGLEEARAYNEALYGIPILDPWLSEASRTPSGPYVDYLGLLAETGAMARLRVPSINVDLPIYHGTTDDVLAKGVGHLYGTSLPVGGEGTHSVLTSHTGLSNATLFDHLDDVVEGDIVLVEVLGETLAYEVDQIKVVLPHETEDLVTIAGEDYLTLVTCTPYAVNTHRLLVRGHRVPFDESSPEAQQMEEQSGLQLEPWMYWLLGGAAAGLLVMIWMLVVLNRRRYPQVAAGDTESRQGRHRGGGRRRGGRRGQRGRHARAP
ncbi:MAG: class C sortase [Actinomycetia bacterium]|nr:class C sortase [Actinomycetes bacterium]